MCIPPASVNFSIEENPKMFLWYIITEKHPIQNTNLDFHKIMRFMLYSFIGKKALDIHSGLASVSKR